MNKKKYMLNFLMDVTNFEECILLNLYGMFTAFMTYLILKDFYKIQRMSIARTSEKVDMLKIKKLLLINMIAQTFGYIIESIGYFYIKDCQTNYYFIVPILYFLLNVTFMTSLQICCWRSTLIWGQLLCLKTYNNWGLSKLINYLKKTAIVDTGIIVINSMMLIFFFATEKPGIMNLIVTIVSIFVLLIFVVVSVLFQFYVLTQQEIPLITKRRVRISIILLTIALSIRLAWNIFLLIQQNWLDERKCGNDDGGDGKDKSHCECNEEDNLFWFYYELIYFPIADLIPIILFNRIYSPQGNNAAVRINRLIDSE